LLVCNRQKELLQNDAERKAYREGLKIWNEYYAAKLYGNHTVDLESKKSWPSLEEIKVMAMEKPMESLSYLVKKSIVSGTQWYKSTLPDIAKKLLHQQGYRQDYTPGVGQIKPGDFNRMKPFSEDFGFDRGGALDRFYIESFLNENSGFIKGAVLELGDNEYTLKFGKDAVETSDILHVDGTNERATFIGDITNVPEIPSEYFDCVICTQKLMLVYDVRAALESCYRILKPGGCLLLTVPGITNIDRGAWKNYWLWSFTDISVRKLMEDTFGNSEIAVKAYGNVHVATSFLYGVGMQEFNKEAFEYQDPSYQVVISAKAIKK
jgi:SAM-dependent methyltransferase